MKFRPLLFALVGITLARADHPASLLGSKIASLAGDAVVLAAIDPTAADVVDEAAEIGRLEAMPAVAIPIQDDTLAGAITTIATAGGMNFIAPAADEFPERVTLTTKVSPWRLLHRLSDRYRFAMAYRDGIWEFNREAVGALVARVYVLKHTNLDVYKASQNAFASVGGATAAASGGMPGTNEGGMVFSAETRRIIDDIRELIGLPTARITSDEKPADQPEKRPIQGKAAETSTEAGKSTAKVIYIADANALYVACTRAQHDLVAGYIELIDRPPRQVHIEARFFETTWEPKTILGLNPQNVQPGVLYNGTLEWGSGGQETRAVLSLQAVELQISALRSDSRGRLVQNPTVVTANNHEVYFSVGDEEPFVSSNNIYPGVPNGGFGATTANVSIRRIGTSVNVLPTIFDGDHGGKRRIRLVVRIEVGALKAFRQVNAINIPVVTSQKYEYTTYVEDNQALAFGGLAGIGERDGVAKVPVAGDVPVVGYLFKSKSREIHQRNLVAYIIARVIDEPEKVVLPETGLRDVAKEAAVKTVFPR